MDNRQDNIKLFMALFQGKQSHYGKYTLKKRQTPGEKAEGDALTMNSQISAKEVEEHLYGEEYGIGVIPITEENTCRFGVIDIDVYDCTLHLEILKKLNSKNIKLVPFRSKSGGLHLYLFLDDFYSAKDVIQELKRYSSILGISTLVIDGKLKETEIFPKQAVTSHIGNWINLPLKNGTRGYLYLKDDQIKEVFDVGFCLDLCEKSKTLITKRKAPKNREDDKDDLYQAPPCIENFLSANSMVCPAGDGVRHDFTAVGLGIYVKKRFPNTLYEKLREYTDKFLEEPLPQNELDRIYTAIHTNDYNYGCSKAPMSQFCEKEACVLKKYGITKLQDINFGDMTIVNNDPNLYLWTINGTEICFTPDDFVIPNRFKKVVLQQGGILLTSNHKWSDLTEIIADTIKHAQNTYVSLCETPKGNLFFHLRQFLNQKVMPFDSVEQKIEILKANGALKMMYSQKEYYFFLMADFLSYLDSVKFKDILKSEIPKIFKQELKMVYTRIRSKMSDADFHVATIPTSIVNATAEDREAEFDIIID